MWINRNSHKKNESFNLIRSHVSIMTTATVIITSLIINIKFAIIIIETTKNDYHNSNNSNNNNNNNYYNNNNNNNKNMHREFRAFSQHV